MKCQMFEIPYKQIYCPKDEVVSVYQPCLLLVIIHRNQVVWLCLALELLVT